MASSGPLTGDSSFSSQCPSAYFGTVWSYINLRELGERHRAKIDWAGNATFAIGLILIMVGITYGIEPSRSLHDGMDECARPS